MRAVGDSLRAMLPGLRRWFRPPARRRVVAGMATMPSRAAVFPAALRSIIGQVDRLYLYLDGHAEVPGVARDDPRVVPIFGHEEPGLGGAGKFVGLLQEPEPCLFVSVDDDIAYPPDHVECLARALARHGSRAVVGVHGVRLKRPVASDLRDRDVFHFAEPFREQQTVDVLGTGTMMLDTATLRFDPRRWRHRNTSDIQVAIEAAKLGLPMICVARGAGFLRPLEQEQADSIFKRMQGDDSRQTTLALELHALRTSPPRHEKTIEIFASHGIVDGFRPDRFAHRNLLDAERYRAVLATAPKFVPLADAMQGRGRALTIDDATVAAARAALLARALGHAVTLFVNPWQIQDGRPYWFSRLDRLLDGAAPHALSWDGQVFDLATFGAKQAFRARVKDRMRRHTAPEQSTALVEDLEQRLDGGGEMPDHLRCLGIDEIRALHAEGVDIQNHCWTHLDPAALSPAEFADDFARAEAWLRQTLGTLPRFFACPFGEFVPHPDFLLRSDTICLMLHGYLAPGPVADRVVNRVTLAA